MLYNIIYADVSHFECVADPLHLRHYAHFLLSPKFTVQSLVHKWVVVHSTQKNFQRTELPTKERTPILNDEIKLFETRSTVGLGPRLHNFVL